MYKLMIVEDEPLIRAGLVKYFNWKELGFTSIIDAENGLDAIEMALTYQPDLIMTDIRMPKMSGLELIEQLRPVLPDCLFVILSGYEDFTYAKQAIQLGVTAYLIKPLQFEQSMETIMECVMKMKAKRQERLKLEEINKVLDESVQLKQEKFVKDLMEQDYSNQDWKRFCELYDFPIEKGRFLAVIFTLNQPKKLANSRVEEQLKSIYTAWSQSSVDIVNCHWSSFSSGPKIYFLVAANESESLTKFVRIVTDRVLKNVSEGNVYCGVGPEVTNHLKMKESKLLAEKAINYRFFTKDKHLFTFSELANVKGYPFQLSEQEKRILIQAIEKADQHEIKNLLKQFEQEVNNHASQATPDKLFAFIQEIIGVCLRFVHKHGIDLNEIYHTKLFSFSFLDDFSTLAQLFDWLGDFIFTIGTNYHGLTVHSAHAENRIFSQIESYIIENIDRDISLSMVANVFFYNATYLSRLFKTKLNKNYTTFVSEIRINYAKECLKEPSIAVSEVGMMCGYQSYKHFIKTFKGLTGFTPTDYRKRLAE
jgi:two-component system, response regulator YesN